jgi:hypothetical protein
MLNHQPGGLALTIPMVRVPSALCYVIYTYTYSSQQATNLMEV